MSSSPSTSSSSSPSMSSSSSASSSSSPSSSAVAPLLPFSVFCFFVVYLVILCTPLLGLQLLCSGGLGSHVVLNLGVRHCVGGCVMEMERSLVVTIAASVFVTQPPTQCL